MTALGRLGLRALALLLPPCALLGRHRRLARAALAAWLIGMLVFWTLAAGPGAILVLAAMLLAPLAV